MHNDLTPEERQELEDSLDAFNDFINGQVRSGTLRLYTLADFIASLYLRMRMHVEQLPALKLMERVINQIEHRISEGDLMITLGPQKDEVPFRSAEQFEADPGLRDMMHDATQSLSDDEIADFFKEQE